MKKPVTQFDYENNLEPDLLRFLIRLEVLEQISKEESRFNSMRELEWDTHISEIKREITFFKSQLSDVDTRLGRFKDSFMSSVSEFKLKADKDELRKLETKIDNMNFENLISRAEFLRKCSLK